MRFSARYWIGVDEDYSLFPLGSRAVWRRTQAVCEACGADEVTFGAIEKQAEYVVHVYCAKCAEFEAHCDLWEWTNLL